MKTKKKMNKKMKEATIKTLILVFLIALIAYYFNLNKEFGILLIGMSLGIIWYTKMLGK